MVIALLVVVNVLLLAVAIPMAVNVARARRRKRQGGLSKPWKIRRVRVDEFDPVFTPGEFGPTRETEVHFIGKWMLGRVTGATSDMEAWILAVLAKRATTLFEFGTCTGRTTYLWARNSPPDARVTTLTLPPAGREGYRAAAGDDPQAGARAVWESAYTHVMYSGTEVEGKVTQLFGDSKAFDETPYVDACDLVFVDGSHAYSYVVSDSRKALRMVRSGGVVLWHDYAGPDHAGDVYRALNELSERLPLVHLTGTTLVGYRRPLDGTAPI